MRARVTALTQDFDGVRALDGVDLDLAAGAIHGLLGRDGAGTTTLLRILAGLDRPDVGEVAVLGAAPWENPRVCLIRDDQTYPQNFRVSHVLRVASARHPAWSDELAADLLARFGLGSGQKVKGLSRGQRSMLGAVAGLASRAPLTLLDEPYLGPTTPPTRCAAGPSPSAGPRRSSNGSRRAFENCIASSWAGGCG